MGYEDNLKGVIKQAWMEAIAEMSDEEKREQFGQDIDDNLATLLFDLEDCTVEPESLETWGYSGGTPYEPASLLYEGEYKAEEYLDEYIDKLSDYDIHLYALEVEDDWFNKVGWNDKEGYLYDKKEMLYSKDFSSEREFVRAVVKGYVIGKLNEMARDWFEN